MNYKPHDNEFRGTGSDLTDLRSVPTATMFRAPPEKKHVKLEDHLWQIGFGLAVLAYFYWCLFLMP